MRDLTEQEKTIAELFKTNGRSGVHQYFVDTLGMSDDEAEVSIDKLDYLPIDSNLNNFEKQGFVPKNQEVDTKTQSMTVTFADGSTKEIQVAEDGTVVSPLSSQEKSHIDSLPVEEKKSLLERLFGPKQ